MLGYEILYPSESHLFLNEQKNKNPKIYLLSHAVELNFAGLVPIIFSMSFDQVSAKHFEFPKR